MAKWILDASAVLAPLNNESGADAVLNHVYRRTSIALRTAGSRSWPCINGDAQQTEGLPPLSLWRVHDALL